MKTDDGFRASPHRFDARLDAFREQWPFAIVILGLILTVFWIMAVAWYPLHLIANGMWISFVDLLRSMS